MKRKNDPNAYDLINRITTTYESNIRFKLKNDIVCRLISEYFDEASSVSILLYDSSLGKDTLRNFGQYFDPFKSEATIEDYSLHLLLCNIPAYEYLASSIESGISIQDCSYSNFIHHELFLNNRQSISNHTFDKIKYNFLGPGSFYLSYKAYKKTISDFDIYDLENYKSPSPEYFVNLVENIKLGRKIQKPHLVLSLNELSENQLHHYKIYTDKLNVKFTKYRYYLALPLRVENRILGIVKIHWNVGNERMTSKERKQIEKRLTVHAKEIGHFIGTIAMLIASSNINYQFKQFQFETGIPKYDEYCKCLRKAINSRACIIRLSEEVYDKIEIRGYDGIAQEYIEDRKAHDHFEEHRSHLSNFFESANRLLEKEKKSLLGVIFEPGSLKIERIRFIIINERKSVVISEYLLSTTTEVDILIPRVFNSVSSWIKDLGLAQIMMIKIPSVNNGYISFGNSKFIQFTVQDIDAVMPQINRLGAEIKIKQRERLRTREKFVEHFAHELVAPLHAAIACCTAINDTTDEVKKSNFSEETIADLLQGIRTSSLTIPQKSLAALEYCEMLLNEYQRACKFDGGLIENIPNPSPYFLIDELYPILKIMRHVVFDLRAIGIFNNWKMQEGTIAIVDSNEVAIGHPRLRVFTNKDLLKGLIINLLSNAYKYSFNATSAAKHIEGYTNVIKGNKNPKGHIQVCYFENDHEYGFAITNWGKIIPPNLTKEIFEPHVTCPIDQIFEPEKIHSGGRGLGLYYAQKYALAMKANLRLHVEHRMSKFTVSWEI